MVCSSFNVRFSRCSGALSAISVMPLMSLHSLVHFLSVQFYYRWQLTLTAFFSGHLLLDTLHSTISQAVYVFLNSQWTVSQLGNYKCAPINLTQSPGHMSRCCSTFTHFQSVYLVFRWHFTVYNQTHTFFHDCPACGIKKDRTLNSNQQMMLTKECASVCPLQLFRQVNCVRAVMVYRFTDNCLLQLDPVLSLCSLETFGGCVMSSFSPFDSASLERNFSPLWQQSRTGAGQRKACGSLQEKRLVRATI